MTKINAAVLRLPSKVRMKVLLVINDPPYGSERVYNALRLAHALVKKDPATQVTVFLMADAVLAGKAQQKTPEGYYNVERMLKRVLSGKGTVLLCGTCMDARGMGDAELMDGAHRSTMDELANATVDADKVLIF
ncbi:MAG: DsrE family protein [Xanthobacteraceae bacterium]